MDSDAMAHMNAEAEFRPPPSNRMTDESQTSCRGNVLGNAPRPIISNRYWASERMTSMPAV